MGHHADKFTVTDGIVNTKYFLNTGSLKPFGCKYVCDLQDRTF